MTKKTRHIVAVAVIATLCGFAAALLHAGPDPAPPAAQPELKAQTTCPIMGGEINKTLYADVNGRRIHVCCGGCIAKVKADPAKAIRTLAARGEAAAPVPEAKSEPQAAGSPATAGKGAAKAKTSEEEHLATVTTRTLATLISSGTPLTILDARTGKFNDGRRIPGARELSAKSSAEEVAGVVKSKDALIVTYCTNLQCGASRALAKRLGELGYRHILEYPEGIDGWEAAGHTVERAAAPAGK